MNEIEVDKFDALDSRYEAIAWGSGLAWVGILGLIPGNQNEIGLLSIGLILLGLNLARYLSKIPANGFTVVLGSVFSALGLAALLRPVLNFPYFELDFFPLLLIVIGLYFLIPKPKQEQRSVQ